MSLHRALAIALTLTAVAAAARTLPEEEAPADSVATDSVATDSVAPAPAVAYTLSNPAPERLDSIFISLTSKKTDYPKPRNSTYWIKQLISNGFLINDPSVEYPRFPRFLLKIYNWGNDVFNTYDTDYVTGTGNNWKLQAKSFNWLESLTMQFPDGNIRMHTHLYADAGGYISFMAVSLGYMINVNELLGTPARRTTFNFDFTCSRFAINLLSQSYEGDMTITQLPGVNGGHHIDVPFSGASVKSTSIDTYYFFNHLRYSQGAAYSFSKYQLRSAGSWMAGLAYSTKSIHLNFSELDVAKLQWSREVTSDLLRSYFFHYSDYQLLGGYGYNWALHPHRWVVNATAMLSVGYRRSFEDASDGKRDMLANGLRFKAAATYNHRALFASLNASLRGGMFYTSQFLFFNLAFNMGVNVGMRF